jgi:glyoxylase-like metal-dependent hydrolase (beta-lactamase superfamily II)
LSVSNLPSSPDGNAGGDRQRISSSAVSDPAAMSSNAFLVRTPTRLVLIDTGTGGKLDNDPSFHGCGHLMENLRAAGFRPEQIDEGLITHRGQDHTGGPTSLDGTRRTFPNAMVYLPKDEFSMVLNAGETGPYINRARNKDFPRSWIDFISSVFAPYVSAGKLLAFDGGITLRLGLQPRPRTATLRVTHRTSSKA